MQKHIEGPAKKNYESGLEIMFNSESISIGGEIIPHEIVRKRLENVSHLIMQIICATGVRVSELKYIYTTSGMTGQAQVRLKGKIRMVILPREL